MRIPKILIVPGSNRGGSYNARLAASAQKVLSTMECDVTRISLRDYPMPIYDGDLEAQKGAPENVVRLVKLFEAHDGVILVSPEYNASMTPLLKNALDWMSLTTKDSSGPISAYKNTIFALAAASPGVFGGIRGLSHLRDVLTSIGATVIAPQVCVGNAESAFDDMDQLINERARGLLKQVCESLVNSSRLLSMR